MPGGLGNLFVHRLPTFVFLRDRQYTSTGQPIGFLRTLETELKKEEASGGSDVLRVGGGG